MELSLVQFFQKDHNFLLLATALASGAMLLWPLVRRSSGGPRVTVQVVNTGDRPVQIGSHYHFFEVNKALDFDRASAFAMRLDIPTIFVSGGPMEAGKLVGTHNRDGKPFVRKLDLIDSMIASSASSLRLK